MKILDRLPIYQRPSLIDVIGESNIGGHLVPQCSADLRLHRNVPGERELRDSYSLTTAGGIAVIPDDLPVAPRLPLLGIKAIIGNDLKLILDGKRREVTLKTGWL